jgi:hypothetical protein
LGDYPAVDTKPKGNVVAKIIERTDAATLTAFVEEAVSEKVDLVATDEHMGYRRIGGKWKHGVIRHGAGEYVRGSVPIVAYGAIEGVVQTLTNRRELRFTLYDSLQDRAVVCHLHEGQEDLMRNAWGKRVIVQGFVTRDGLNGRPLQISRITDVIPVIAGDYKKGRGALKSAADAEKPEDVIRRLRDA